MSTIVDSFKLIIYITLVISISAQILEDLYRSITVSDENTQDLRSKFLNEKKKNHATSTREKLLDKYFNDSVFIDNVMHVTVEKLTRNMSKQIKLIENDFKNMIYMNGLTYIYKRDMHWRTWRIVKFPDKPKIIYYKCESSVVNRCSNCTSGGYWNIDIGDPPCPYEITSLTSNNRLCSLNVSEQLSRSSLRAAESCLSNVSYGDLTATCNNPIETEYLITKKFTAGADVFPKTLCGDRVVCGLVTVYKINKDHVSFKIINATSQVIYSRVMKPGIKPYVCIKNCGTYDYLTKTVLKNKSNKPFTVNLIRKNKRENKPQAEDHNNATKKIAKRSKHVKSIGLKTNRDKQLRPLPRDYHLIDQSKRLSKVILPHLVIKIKSRILKNRTNLDHSVACTKLRQKLLLDES